MRQQKRRNKGEGSITRLPNGNYKMTITLGTGIDGKQKRKSVSAKTKTELMKKVTELRLMVGQDTKTNMYFKDVVALYMKTKEESWSHNTLANYMTAMRTLYEPLYDFRIDKITPALLDELLDSIRTRSGKPVAPSTLKAHRMKLSTIFNFAVSRGYIDRSPVKNTKVRQKARLKVDKVILPTEQEMQDILREAKAYDDSKKHLPMYPLCLLAVATGARLGELLDLEWSDINLEASTISINSQSTYGGNNQTLKTTSSYRVIFVQPEILKTALGLLKVSEETSRVWTVFGKPLGYARASSQVQRFIKGANSVPEGFTFHCFRHYHATQLLLKGISVKEVSKRLGHSNIMTTLNLYAHWLPEMDKTAANTISTSMII